MAVTLTSTPPAETRAPKDPQKVTAGRAAMAARWGPRRHIALDALPSAVANVIRLLVSAAEAAAREEAGPADNGPALAEGHSNDRSAA